MADLPVIKFVAGKGKLFQEDGFGLAFCSSLKIFREKPVQVFQ